ncbi:MAG TPA: cereblon family protein [Clostridia bacterium]|nr:cereblon family protein [Clostridia bacterium]
MNGQPLGSTGAGTPITVAPELQTRATTATASSEGDWLCAWCYHAVANERSRFCFNGKDEFKFTNPEGIRFEIITFSETSGCHQAGVPTLEHTWFPGHAWSYCHCAQCGQQLGWYFTGQSDFAGLIKGRVIQALPLRN